MKELDFSDQIIGKRSGPKSGAQTPAKPSERKKGSSKNKPGSAGKDGPSITFSAKVIEALKNKVKEHNAKSKKKVTLSQLKKVYRRGAGAFSSSHRPGMSRGGWAMARVNTFLKMRRGGKVKDSYRKADQDIAKSSVSPINDGVEDEITFTVEEMLEANLDIEKYDLLNECDCDFDDLFAEEEEEGFEEIIDDETWAAEDKKGKKLNKPFRTPGGPKKFSVYVKNEKGNVVKVNFGDPNMEIKRDDPARRKSFRARHNCENPGPKTKARYWSCKQWRAGTKVKGSEVELTDNEIEAIILDELDETRSAHNMSKYTFDNPGEAMKMAKKMGMDKIHKGKSGEKDIFMPGASHSELLKKVEESDAGHGLWHNIQMKKQRMGKNYRPAKPGDKDRPSKEALEKAKKSSKADKHEKEDKKEDDESGLTEKQKKLPDFIKKNLLKKKKAKAEDKEEKDDSGLTDKQKKLPDFIKKNILKNKKKKGEDKEEKK